MQIGGFAPSVSQNSGDLASGGWAQLSRTETGAGQSSVRRGSQQVGAAPGSPPSHPEPPPPPAGLRFSGLPLGVGLIAGRVTEAEEEGEKRRGEVKALGNLARQAAVTAKRERTATACGAQPEVAQRHAARYAPGRRAMAVLACHSRHTVS